MESYVNPSTARSGRKSLELLLSVVGRPQARLVFSWPTVKVLKHLIGPLW